jgi:hypothetical protein
VGNNGETLVADSSTSTGLRYQGNFAAGKNKIINGDFGVWQRGTSVALTNSTRAYGPDRIAARSFFSAGTSTISQQTFTPGTAPVAGYEGSYFARIACGSTATAWQYDQRIEDVRTFAGQTITYSFYIKASAANSSTTIEIVQNFGSGGSASVTTNATGPSVTTAWQRFSVTIAIPSISGKTIGTSSYLEISVYSNSGVTNSMTVDTWGWQVEAGSVATAFQTATGTIQGELAACQRYFQIIADGTGQSISMIAAYSSTNAYSVYQSKVTMRTTPTIYQVSGTNYFLLLGNGLDNDTFDSVTALENGSSNAVRFSITSGISMTQGYSYWFQTNNASARLGLQAEL